MVLPVARSQTDAVTLLTIPRVHNMMALDFCYGPETEVKCKSKKFRTWPKADMVLQLSLQALGSQCPRRLIEGRRPC